MKVCPDGGLRTPDSGQQRLGVSTTGMGFAPRRLGAFVVLHPGIETSVQAHNRQTLVHRENHWYLVYPQGKPLSPAARAFLSFARTETKGLVLGSFARG